MKFILASKSPRRKEILENLGFDFEIITAQTDENSEIKDPKKLVTELAKRKALAVKQKQGKTDKIILASDTVVATGKTILGKPKDEQDARKMLMSLSGKKHSVYSGICLIKGEKTLTRFCKTDVYFDLLEKADIDRYIATNEWTDKAGAYAVQGKASVFVKKIDGDYFNVVGLPVNLLHNMLKEI